MGVAAADDELELIIVEDDGAGGNAEGQELALEAAQDEEPVQGALAAVVERGGLEQELEDHLELQEPAVVDGAAGGADGVIGAAVAAEAGAPRTQAKRTPAGDWLCPDFQRCQYSHRGSGEARLKGMLAHVESRHKQQGAEAMEALRQTILDWYDNERKVRKSKSRVCRYCHQTRSGGSAQVTRHYRSCRAKKALEAQEGRPEEAEMCPARKKRRMM